MRYNYLYMNILKMIFKLLVKYRSIRALKFFYPEKQLLDVSELNIALREDDGMFEYLVANHHLPCINETFNFFRLRGKIHLLGKGNYGGSVYFRQLIEVACEEDRDEILRYFLPFQKTIHWGELLSLCCKNNSFDCLLILLEQAPKGDVMSGIFEILGKFLHRYECERFAQVMRPITKGLRHPILNQMRRAHKKRKKILGRVCLKNKLPKDLHLHIRKYLGD